MKRPDDVSEEAWEATKSLPDRFAIDVAAGQTWDIRHTVSRLIMAERARCATVALDIAEKNRGYSDGPGALRVYNVLSAPPQPSTTTSQ